MKNLTKLWLVFGLILVFQDLMRILLKLEIFRFIDEIAFIMIALVVLFVSISRKRFKLDNVAIFAGLIFIFGIILEISKANPKFINLIYVLYGMKLYFVYLIAQNLDITYGDYTKILDWLGYIFLIFGAIGIIDYLLNNVILQSLGFEIYFRYGLPRITGFFIHPHPLGWMAAIFSFYFFLKYLFIEKNKRNIIFSLCSIIILILTNNRKSMLGLIITTLILYIVYIQKQLSVKSRKRIIMGAIVLVLLITFLYLNSIIYVIKATKEEYIDSVDAPRMVLYRTGFQIMEDKFPLGAGVATFGSIGSLRPYSDIYAEYRLDNIYGFSEDNPLYVNDAWWATIIGEQGFIGLILYIVIICFIFFKLVLRAKITNSRMHLFFIVFGMFLLIEGVIESFVAPTFFYFLYMYFIFGTIGIVLSKKKSKLNVDKY